MAPPTETLLRVQLIGHTEFSAPASVDFTTDATGGQALTEFAGRSIYESWEKAVPATATNAGFLHHILQVGHLSVLEHASATFYVTGLSRAAAHELIRHRHFSVAQLSPRAGARGHVVPVGLDPQARRRFEQAMAEAERVHADLLDALEQAAGAGAGSTARRKQARQAAAAVIPAAAATAVVVTGNYRSWRHFIGTRATDPADIELRSLAVAVLRELQTAAEQVFADFRISELPDGTQTAASPYIGEG